MVASLSHYEASPRPDLLILTPPFGEASDPTVALLSHHEALQGRPSTQNFTAF